MDFTLSLDDRHAAALARIVARRNSAFAATPGGLVTPVDATAVLSEIVARELRPEADIIAVEQGRTSLNAQIDAADPAAVITVAKELVQNLEGEALQSVLRKLGKEL
jgi:hypothetical protein